MDRSFALIGIRFQGDHRVADLEFLSGVLDIFLFSIAGIGVMDRETVHVIVKNAFGDADQGIRRKADGTGN